MSNQGPLNIQEIMSKYSKSQIEKFDAIMSAQTQGNTELSDRLEGQLSQSDSSLFDQYIADLQLILAYKKSLDADSQRLGREISALDGEIDQGKAQRGAILTKHQAQMSEDAASFRVTSAPESSSNGHSAKKKGGCTIL